MALAVPPVPSTAAGGEDWPSTSSPQQTTAPLAARIAQLWSHPAARALAVPPLPSTAAGGEDWPSKSRPQQTTAPLPAWIAQLWPDPAAMALAALETSAGSDD
jgi:hypothetical protein